MSLVRSLHVQSLHGTNLPGRRSKGPEQGRNEAKNSVTTGTGYFLNRDGYVITNNHVVNQCSSVRVKSLSGSDVSARVVARDTQNDIALISTSIRGSKSVSIRFGARLGEQVAAFGFPHTD